MLVKVVNFRWPNFKIIIKVLFLYCIHKREINLVELCKGRDLVIMNAFFKHPERRLYTWKSPGDMYRNQIDYIINDSRFKNCVKNVKTFPGADIASDRNPVVINLNAKTEENGKVRIIRSEYTQR